MLSRAAGAYRVLFWEEPEWCADLASPTLRQTQTADGVTVITPLLPVGLDGPAADRAQTALLKDSLNDFHAEPAVLWFYTPMALAFAGDIAAGTIVYDCMDELTRFRGASPRLLLLERRLLRAADVVFTGGHSLQRAKQQLHANVHCFPSAVERAHFARARDWRGAPPADQAALKRPRIGYFGVLDERIDFALIDHVARLRREWQIVLLGPLAKIGAEDLPRGENIHWLGGKDYAQLPGYLAGWDAGLMPFARNEATEFISPTKTPEYLAAGVPLVSTPIADVVSAWGRGGLVDIADGADNVVCALQDALAREKAAWRARADLALSGISWDATWQAMQALIATATRHAGGNRDRAASDLETAGD